MTLSLDLSLDEEARVRAAQQRGIDVSALLRGLLSGLPPESPALPEPAKNGERTNDLPNLKTAENDPTLALLARWREEDESRASDEILQDEKNWQEFQQGINTNRVEAGARLIY